jgi:predicted nucleic acid-binding Zn ribbon protein
MAKKLDKLSHTLKTLLRANGLDSRVTEYGIMKHWEKSVGTGIACHARPEAVRGKKLFLTVDSPAWMQQLSLLKPEIIEKVNRTLQKNLIKEITLRLGEIPSAEKTTTEQPGPAPELTTEESGKIEQYVREINDPPIRDALRRLIEKDFLRNKQKQNK